MKGLCVILTLIVTASAAQDTLRFRSRADSVLNKLDSLKAFSLESSASLVRKPDSMKIALVSKYDQAVVVVNKPAESVAKIDDKVSRLQQRLTTKLDSLTRFPKPDTTLIFSLDSLRGKLDELTHTDLLKDVNESVDKLQGEGLKINEQIDGIENRINEKLGLFRENGGNVGSVDLPSVSLRQGNFANNPLENPGKDIKVPGLPTGSGLVAPELPQAKIGTDIPGMEKVKDVMNAPKEKLGELTDIDALNDIKSKAGDVTKIAQSVEGYADDAKKLVEGNLSELEALPDQIEARFASLEEVQALQKETVNYTEMMKKWNSDPDVMKEMALNKAKEQAINHFAGHEEELKAAMEKLGELKSKQKDAEAVVDLFKKRTHAMKGRPFAERLVPGIDLQLQLASHQWIDFNPRVGYRWTTRWTTGIGWNERLAMSVKDMKFIPEEHVYGPRGYLEFKFKENFHLKAEAEVMNAIGTSSGQSTAAEPDHRSWLWSYFAGFKKSFSFAPTVRGNVQVLYNLYDPDKNSPYMTRLSIRMGFEFPIRKSGNTGLKKVIAKDL